jgi:copper transport protein
VALSVGLVFAVVVGAAQPAAAHAVLLRTDPSPQTTVPKSPAAIRLYFSEPVEVAFGAVRLFDVDGHRVDAGSLRRASGDREVVLPVRGLKDGTYTVTWRVASADGHRVSGGFDFYVGAPSTISAVAVARDQGPGRFVGWGYGVVRFGWFCALLGIIGLVAVRRWVWTPSVGAAGLTDSGAARSFRVGFRRALPALWVALALSGALTLLFQASTLSGLSVWAAARPETLGEVLRTFFGRVWLAEMGLTVLALVPVFALARGRQVLGRSLPTWIAALGVLLFGLCLCAGLNGHARTDARPALAIASIAIHLLAVGVWVGGLAALVVFGGAAWRKVPGSQRVGLLRQLVPRFSRLAVGAVAVVIVSGTVNSISNLAAVSDLWRVTYGRVLLAKILILLVALVVAARHRWVVPRRLANPDTPSSTVRSFQRTAAIELGLLVGAIALAAALVAHVPGRSIALLANGPVNQERTVGAYTAQLVIDPTTVGANQLHVTFVNAQGLGAAEVTNTTVTVGQAGAPAEPTAMRLISPGHFVGDVTLPTAGEYRVTVTSGGASTTFSFHLKKESGR